MDAYIAARPVKFLLTPLREGRLSRFAKCRLSRLLFLLTPLREGRLHGAQPNGRAGVISTHAPAGGATVASVFHVVPSAISTHAPAGGATAGRSAVGNAGIHFYSRPCGRGDIRRIVAPVLGSLISTHAPAGGATAIFHKSVMRFCGKLPKDDTVLCLASFGFPRRDPKAVYLA